MSTLQRETAVPRLGSQGFPFSPTMQKEVFALARHNGRNAVRYKWLGLCSLAFAYCSNPSNYTLQRRCLYD